MKVRRECWVTSALNPEQCMHALILAKSLRGVFTTRSLVILVSDSLPMELWELLQDNFYQCVRIRVNESWTQKALPDFIAKLHAWSLVPWESVVYLQPDLLFVKNYDELFSHEGYLEESAAKSVTDLPVFVTHPSIKVWTTLAQRMDKCGNVTFETILGDVLKNSNIPDSKIVCVDLTQGFMAKNLDEIKIVKFSGVQPINLLAQDQSAMITGTLEKAIMDLWTTHFEQGIAQSLFNVKNGSFDGIQNLLEKYGQDQLEKPLSMEFDNSKDAAVAIIGMSFRLPGANNPEEFWKLLTEGQDGIIPTPEERLTPERCPHILHNDQHRNVKAGFLKCPIDEIDAKFFGMSPMELSFTDPQQRMTLQVAWEALEDAGIDPSSLNISHTGVFCGAWRTDYQSLMQKVGVADKEFLRTYLGNSLGILSGRISHCLGLTGPSIGTESGCSSSIVAVDLACKSLLRGETDLNLACGVNLILYPFSGNTMNSILARDFRCKTFDASADGFARAEACAVLVLKRYADAVNDGDRVYGLIRGSAVVQEGASRSLGTPSKYCEALAMKLALEDAGVHPAEVSFVETHGTGTPVGDPLEVAAIGEAYYDENREGSLIIGSVKTNIGHTESVSGIAGIIKVLLSMKNEAIPKHINFETLNPAINLDSIPAKIPMETMQWKRSNNGKPRIAGVSSFGITGTDAHAIVQETPNFKPQGLLIQNENQRPSVLTISAKSKEALADNLKAFQSFLKQTEESLMDITFTANTGRSHYSFRTAIIGSTKTEILENMKNCVKGQASEECPKICFLFTGQGSQYPGMAKDLYTSNPTFQMHFDQCDRILQNQYDVSIKDALWGNNTSNIGRTIYSQTSIFCVEYCLLKLWESWGIKPDFVLGHSLGEYAAAVGAGILKFEDALKLVAERSRLIDGLPGGKMVVLKESFEKVDELLKIAFSNSEDRWLDYAAVNSPDQTVLAGSEENVIAFCKFCKNNQIKTHILDATHAFHSRHMDPILKQFEQIASTIEYQKPTCTYISGMEGQVIAEDNQVNADYWIRHTRDRVRFAEASKTVMHLGCNLFLEVGPQPVLSALTMINSDGLEGIGPVTCLPSIKKQDKDWPTILSALSKLYLSGQKIDWKRFHQFSQVNKVTIPFYQFQNKPYWFEMPDCGPQSFHPFVGAPISNASSVKIFSNTLQLDNVEFLKDHAIGNEVIFPGAGFLEMCLVSGHAATQCTETAYFPPPAPITLQDFAIESPLSLRESNATNLQVTVTSEESGETRVTISSKLVLDKETHKWIRHASGVFSPFVTQTDSDVDETLDAIRSRCIEKVMIDENYEKLAEFGLKFGETFRTLRGMWKTVENNECLFEAAVTDNPEKYICHPTMSDAMFQAIMISTNPNAPKLHVPVSIQQFQWFTKIETQTCYIHCIKELHEPSAVLYDSNGQKLAKMIGATLIETTVSSIMSALEAQRMSLPTAYEDVWRTQMGPMGRRCVPKETFNYVLFTESFQEECANLYNQWDQVDIDFNIKSQTLCAMYMIKGLYDLGWTPELGAEYDILEFVKMYEIRETLQKFIRYIFFELAEDGYFEIKDTAEFEKFRLIKMTPPMEKVLESINNLNEELYPISPHQVGLMSRTATKLASIVTGKESALPILFPDDPNETINANNFYAEAKIGKTSHECGSKFFENFLQNVDRNGILRILEVGAGTGSTTKDILPHLNENRGGYEYAYTDISPVFFQMGRKIFEDTKIKAQYRLLNIEEDIASQGFIPHHYDLVIANNVLHVTKNITQAVQNCRNLLVDGGLLAVTESIKPYRPSNLIFGLLDGYWLFTDFHLRPHNCEMDLDRWEFVFKNNGFDSISKCPVFSNHVSTFVSKAKPSYKYVSQIMPIEKKKIWILFTKEDAIISTFLQEKLLELGTQVVTVSIANSEFKKTDQFSYQVRPKEDEDIGAVFSSFKKESNWAIEGVIYLWGLNFPGENYSLVCKPLLSICKNLVVLDQPKIYVITNRLLNIGDQEVSPPMASPIIAMVKTFQNEQSNAICRLIDMDIETEMEPSEHQLSEVFADIFINDDETQVAYRKTQRCVIRFCQIKLPNNILKIPKSEKFHLILPASRSINDLKFAPFTAQTSNIKNEEIEIRVKAYALNFRDVFAVMKPSSEFEKLNSVGLDFSGVVTAVGENVTKCVVGDAVFGINLQENALPSHITTDAETVLKVPDEMTFCEAATIPAVAATAYKCLVQVGKLTAKDTILIHTASGGVGLCAIQIAMHIGAKIVATAGNKRKRAFLRSLGVQHVFHSRNTDYENDIRNALNGQGVDVILNSLTSAGFKEATLAVCNEGARFIEMSKLNVWTNDEVAALRPDVKYDIVDLSASSVEEMKSLMKDINSFMNNSCIRPLPYVQFPASEIREALTYLQKAKHIGKVICVMPEPATLGQGDGWVTPMFNDRSTYLITGGLGGIGIEVAKWMAQSGAKHLVLVGRNLPSEAAAAEISQLNTQFKKNVISLQCDVGDFEQCKNLLKIIKSDLPPLRGIMHAAGVLSDAVFSNQTWDKYLHSYNPKVDGGWNLHKLTLHYGLEHFVMFSSVAAIFGPPGQSNHSSANFFLDSLAQYRHSIGLPATTVNWGQWGQVGVAANLEVTGLRPLTILQGISALDRTMKCQKLQTTILEGDLGIVKKLMRANRQYLAEINSSQTVQNKEIDIDKEKVWKEYDAATEDAERVDILKRLVRTVVCTLLKFDSDDSFSDDDNLQDLGMDSLMMIEMKNVIQTFIGKRAIITANSVKDCFSVNQLATRLFQLIEKNGTDDQIPTKEEHSKLVYEDSNLPAHIQPAVTGISRPSEIKTVLIVGATGTLGSYILRDLSNRTNIHKIYCLIREPEKVEKTLEKKKLISKINMKKVECVIGSITKSKLGLSEEKYKELSESVDAVFNLAVKQSFLDVYKKIENGENDCRSVNVIGTLNLLEFACSLKTKLFYHASDIAINLRLNEDETSMSETWPEPEDFKEFPNFAYPNSKFICERLMSQAVERDLPVKVFRFTSFGGDSQTGAYVSYEDNQLMIRMMSYLYLGCIPDLPTPLFVLPVDVCSKLSLQVFFDDNAPFDIYNVYNLKARNEPDFISVANELGFDQMEIVELEKFREKLQEKEGNQVMFMKLVSEHKYSDYRLNKNAPKMIQSWTTSPSTTFRSNKLSKFIPEYETQVEDSLEVVKRDLKFAKDSGVFTLFGI